MTLAVEPADPRFDAVRMIARQAVRTGATPGLQLSVRWRENPEEPNRFWCWDHVEGRLSYHPAAPLVSAATTYDLASVTKAIVALALVRIVHHRGLDLAVPLADIWPETIGSDAGHASLDALLSHRADLPAWLPYYRAVDPTEPELGIGRERILSQLTRTPLEPSEGAARYSDVGYMLLGEALVRLTGQSLPSVVREQVTEPLGLGAVLHYRGVGPADRDTHVAPTEQCPWRGRVIQGNVHDENAYALQGIAGHAGLFGTASSLTTIGWAALESLRGRTDWFAPDAMRAMVAVRPGGSHRLGWDGKSSAGSSAGTRMSSATFGHLGFTGTSLWCDPTAGVVVALVTNRIHPTRDNQAIRPLRISIHDAIMTALG